MPFNGSGAFSPPGSDFPAVANTLIESAKFNNVINDIATGLSTCVTKDGQTVITANIPLAGFKLTGMGVGSAAADSVRLGQAQAEAFIWAGTAAGTADDIELTVSPAITALAAGMRFLWIAGASPNTGAMTIAISGLSAVALKNDGAAMAANQHAAGKMYMGVYDGTAVQIVPIRVSLASLIEDLTPQLGGDLDVVAETIFTSVTNGDIVILPDGTGAISVSGTTDYENNVTDDDDIPNKKYVDDGIAAITLPAPSFTSTEQTVTVDTVLNVAHGLGVLPKLVQVALRCKSADLGYSVNDEVLAGGWGLNGTGPDSGVIMQMDTTNVTIVQGSSATLISQSTLNAGNIDPTKWKWVVRAWA